MNKMVSVIIPVYNTEAFLDRCIESIVNQVYKNLEIILVDDGSSDRSGVLCDNWANKDSRIRVIHKPNGGVSSARNIGIEKAQGELIQFIDSDDYVNDDYIGNMVDIFEKHDVDMVITGFKIINDRKKDIEKRLLGNYAFNLSPENRDIFLNLLVNGFMTYVVTKMYKKESIKYQFNESTPLGEDIIFNLKNARDMSSIGICTGSGYVYEFNETSATHKKRDNMFDIQKKSIDEIANFLDLKFNTHNIGDFYQCIEIADSILEIITMETIEKVKPVSFSTNLFVSHIIETMRLVALAKLYTLSDDLEEFFLKIKDTLKVQLPEMDCIIAIRDYLEGKVYSTGNIEDYSAYSKVIFLLLQEFSELKDDYKRFAQNIYQAKLLSNDLHQREIEMLCDLLIAYAYSKMGINKKAEFIYQDIAFVAEKSAMFNILIITKFLYAKLKQANNDISEALVLINDSLALIKKYNNQSKILYGLLQKLYVEIVSENDISGVDIESENLKLNDLNTKLVKILN